MEYLLVLVVSALAGFIAPITGGGGLLLIPTLLHIGYPAEVAIASVRLGALGLWLVALRRYHRAGLVDWRVAVPLAVLAAAGGLIGSQVLIHLSHSTETLDMLVAWIVLAMLPVTYISGYVRRLRLAPPPWLRVPGYILYFLVMCFAGLFSGGDGTLGIYVLMLCFGHSILEANANRSLSWLAMGAVASTRYIGAGMVDYELAACLLAGMAVGGYAGAATAIQRGEDWVRLFFAAVVFCLAMLLLFG